MSRKVSGLPIENSFEEIGQNMDNSLEKLLENMLPLLNNIKIDKESLKEPYKDHIKLIEYIFEYMKKNLPKTLSGIEFKGKELKNFDNFPVGLKPFREYKPIKELNVSSLSSSEVVFTIEKELKKDSISFNEWKKRFEDTYESKIIMAYTLMNWAGYYPDDFDKIKRNHDRFLSSTNDMRHVTKAIGANFLISNDKAFCKKAIAAYEYVGIKTIVCSLKEFIDEYVSS